MNEVKRYIPTDEMFWLGGHVEPAPSSPEGWVMGADYDALVATNNTNAAEHRDGRLAALERIRELEAALREIADFSEQFIGDDEDGDERMYKVHTIADTALGFQSDAADKATGSTNGFIHASEPMSRDEAYPASSGIKCQCGAYSLGWAGAPPAPLRCSQSDAKVTG